MKSVHKYLERGIIEVAPLAFMRGRTLDNAFIILDEAQNTTPEQMKMFLTRLRIWIKSCSNWRFNTNRFTSKKKSGLIQAMDVLKDVEGIGINKFTEKDVVRHELVQRIIKAYEKYDKKKHK